ncbi:MAG: ArsR/SmtB family transcription factor [Chitinophagales bacterium]
MGYSTKKPKSIEVGNKEKCEIKGEDLLNASLTLRAINNPLRQKIINLVNSNKDIIVSEIYKKLKIEQSVASQHLGILRNTNFLNARRDGKRIHYSVNEDRFKEVKSFIESVNL